jgi:glycine oxidase
VILFLGLCSVASPNICSSALVATGPYLDLCLQSRHMYADWVAWLEETAGCGRSTGFSAAGGFLAPAFAGDAVQRWQPPAEAGAAYYLDGAQMRCVGEAYAVASRRAWWC